MPNLTWTHEEHSSQTFIRTEARAISSASVQYAVAFLLLSVFRLGGLTHQSLWFDEGYTLNLVSTGSVRQFLELFGSYTTSEHLQPLYYVLMYGWSRLAGTSDTALRLPSALFSIVSGLLLFAIVRRLTTRGAVAYAMLGVGMFAMSSYSIFYAQEARPYACIQCFSFFVLLAWLNQSARQHRDGTAPVRLTITLAVACAFACLASVFGTLLVFSLAVADLYRLRRQMSAWWREWCWSILSSGGVLSGYALFAKLRFPAVVAKDIVSLKQPLWMNALYTVFGTMFGTTIGPTVGDLHGASKIDLLLEAWPVLVFAGVVIVSILWAIAQLASKPRGMPYVANVAGLASLIYATVFLVVFGVIGKLNILPRHASALFCLVILVVAACALRPSWQDMHMQRSVLVAGLAGAFVLNCISAARSIYATTCRKDDYRAVATALSSNREGIYLVSGQTTLLEHYGIDINSAVDVEPAQLENYLVHASGSAAHITVVANTFRNYRWDGAPPVQTMLQPAYACRQENDFAYFEVLTCSRQVRTLHDVKQSGRHAR